ncbi:hypothetical protein FQA39_LY15850 [Lamprigera yunnana]|nr:hypothetical protein FQA39_LY15850 [Lamprigera yunnana]
MLSFVVFSALLATAGVSLAQNEDVSYNRIVGGVTAFDGQYPYQISLRTLQNRHFCGGSIISASWVLTAAHCVYGKGASSMVVVVGTNYLHAGGQSYRVWQVIRHEGYDPNTNINDVALLHVRGNITFSSRVKTVELDSSYPASGTKCILSGWGLTSYPSQQLPELLQHITLYAIPLNTCLSSLTGRPVSNTNLCTMKAPGQGACQGDSGGPLVANNKQVGVVSWGIPCAKGVPDVFASISAFRSWIRSKSGV